MNWNLTNQNLNPLLFLLLVPPLLNKMFLNLNQRNKKSLWRITISDNLDSKGTYLRDIITNAYDKNHFISGGEWTFDTIMRDVQFKDKAKFCRCLELFDVATSDAHKRKLEEPGLNTKPLLLDTATDIAKEAMKKLMELGKTNIGYSGVGQRVRTVMKKAY